jgi:phage-related protein
MRTLYRSEAFNDFYASLEPNAQNKLDYALTILSQMKVVSTKFVKRIAGTDLYELRISVSNEYRVMIASLDHENIIESKEVILLNGFMKKSSKDYKSQIETAHKLIELLSDDQD